MMADKAAAHFTSPMRHDWAKTHDVIKIVHLYGESFRLQTMPSRSILRTCSNSKQSSLST
jgi:hypothetical protein